MCGQRATPKRSLSVPGWILPGHQRTLLLLLLITVCARFADGGPSGCPGAGTNSPSQTMERSPDEWREILKSVSRNSSIPPELIKEMVDLLNDPAIPETMRGQVGIAFGRLGKRGRIALPELVKMYRDAVQPERRLWILKSFARFGGNAPETAPLVIETLGQPRRDRLERMGCLDVLAQIGTAHEQVVPALVQLLATEAPARDHLSMAERSRERVLTIEALGTIGPAGAVGIPDLIHATRDASEPVRRAAASSLGRMGDASEVAADALLELVVDDPSEAVRDAAAISLASCGRRTVPAVQYLAEHRDSRTRCRAVRAAGRVPGNRGTQLVPLLKDALTDPDESVRLEACRSLQMSMLATRPVLDCLCNLISSTDRSTRIAAVRLLDKMKEDVRLIEGRLINLARGTDPAVRQSARKALDNLRKSKALR